ncbi:hypothetical protein [Pseudaestuariivita sp.]
MASAADAVRSRVFLRQRHDLGDLGADRADVDASDPFEVPDDGVI